MASESEFDLMDETMRLLGKSECFEPGGELRNLFLLIALLPLLMLLNLFLLLLYNKENAGCAIPSILINLTFICNVILVYKLGNKFIEDLEEENEYDSDVLYMVDAPQAKTFSKLLFFSAILIAVGGFAVGFFVSKVAFFPFLSIVHAVVIVAIYYVAMKAMKKSDVFGVIRE